MFFTDQMSKHIYQKAVKVPQKWHQYLQPGKTICIVVKKLFLFFNNYYVK